MMLLLHHIAKKSLCCKSNIIFCDICCFSFASRPSEHGVVNKTNSGCRIGACCAAISLYADDVILLAPSVSTLQTLVNFCELEFVDLDMAVNVKKSVCICFGLRSKNTCANVVAAGVNIAWITSARYLRFILKVLLDLNVHSPKKLDFIDLLMQFLVRLDDVPQRR